MHATSSRSNVRGQALHHGPDVPVHDVPWHDVLSRQRYVVAHGMDQVHPARWPFSSSTHALLFLKVPAIMLLALGRSG